jgi:azurin
VRFISSFCLLVLFALTLPFAGAVEKITIKAISGLQYDIKQFAVEPGATVAISFINDDATDMPHNLVFTKPGKRMEVVNAAMAMGAEAIATGFVPKTDDVIAAIPEVKPHQKATLSFTVPSEKGIYDYVCTYPGHGLIMFGQLYVGVPMPQLKAVVEETENNPHAYPLTRPYLYRLFMPNSNPASVAIMLPGDINLCWDASACRPRYVWQGAGVDISKYWKGNGSGRVKLVGDTLWEAGAESPLRFAKTSPATTAFKGYALHQGFPEFRYLLDGVLVKELIRDHTQGLGIDISFQVDTDKALYYVVDPQQNALFTSSIGEFKNGVLAIPAKSGRSFTITLMPAAKDSK